MAESFNSAAAHYQRVAVLQQTVAKRLLERLQLINIDPGRVLDLGAGAGSTARLLAKSYHNAAIVHADLALKMLCQSRQGFRRFFSRHAFVCTDAECLALAGSSIDLVFSNLMLQWCNDIDQVFAEINRITRSGGLFIFSSLGPDTLSELRQSWSAVDDTVHVNAFVDMHDLGDALVRAGFEQPVMETEGFTMTYRNVDSLMRELKLLGAHNVNVGRRRSLTGKGRLKGMLNEYEKWRKEGRLPATYEVIYGHAWCRTQSEKQDPDRGVVSVPVSAITHRQA
ncbi:MAG: malonyl-ACP O-methyltransferase BioC [Gammaproteobacteria bacterium]